MKTKTLVSYHKRKFKVVTVKGTFFHCQGQTMEDRNEYLTTQKDKEMSLPTLKCMVAHRPKKKGQYFQFYD